MLSLTSLGKAVGDPNRVRILNVLRQSELCVCELVDVLELGQSTLSTHLQTLRNARVVATEKRRTWIIYSIAPEARKTIEYLFSTLTPEDAQTRIDNERLSKRIQLREDGCCVLSYGALRAEEERVHTN